MRRSILAVVLASVLLLQFASFNIVTLENVDAVTEYCADAVFTPTLPLSFTTGKKYPFVVKFDRTFSSISKVTAHSYFAEDDTFGSNESYHMFNFGGQNFGEAGGAGSETYMRLTQIDPTVLKEFGDGIFEGTYISEKGNFKLISLRFCIEGSSTSAPGQEFIESFSQDGTKLIELLYDDGTGEGYWAFEQPPDQVPPDISAARVRFILSDFGIFEPVHVTKVKFHFNAYNGPANGNFIFNIVLTDVKSGSSIVALRDLISPDSGRYEYDVSGAIFVSADFYAGLERKGHIKYGDGLWVDSSGIPPIPPREEWRSEVMQNGTWLPQADRNMIRVLVSSVYNILPIEPLTVKTNKSLYGTGETITISGTVPAVIPDELAVLQVFNPNNQQILIEKVKPNTDRTYSTNIKVGGPLGINGIYTAKVTYSGESAETSFRFVAPTITPPSQTTPKPEVKVTRSTLSLDKTSYTLGEEFSLKVKASPRSNIAISIIDPKGDEYKTVFVQTDSDGSFTYTSTLPKNAQSGIWEVAVATGDDILRGELLVIEPIVKVEAQITTKDFKKTRLVQVKNTGSAPIHKLEFNADGLQFISALGKQFYKDWKRERQDPNTVTLESVNPLLPGKFLLGLLKIKDRILIDDAVKFALNERVAGMMVTIPTKPIIPQQIRPSSIVEAGKIRLLDIEANTDIQAYHAGQEVIINGVVLSELNGVSEANVKIQVIDPFGKIINEKITLTDGEGNFISTFILGKHANSGDYKVKIETSKDGYTKDMIILPFRVFSRT